MRIGSLLNCNIFSQESQSPNMATGTKYNHFVPVVLYILNNRESELTLRISKVMEVNTNKIVGTANLRRSIVYSYLYFYLFSLSYRVFIIDVFVVLYWHEILHCAKCYFCKLFRVLVSYFIDSIKDILLLCLSP